MKKFVAAALALAMVMSLAACNKAEPTESSEEETTTTATSETETETEAETEPSETEPVIPDGYSLVELTSDYLGVKVSYAALDDGRFAGSVIKPNKNVDQYGRTEFEVNFYSDEDHQMSNNVKATVSIWARNEKKVQSELKSYAAVEGADYEGCWHSEIGEETKCYFELFTAENSYIDGRIEVEVNMFAYADFMALDEYKTMVDTMIKTMKIEILDTNALNDAEGNFPVASGNFTIPSKVTIAGKEYQPEWTLSSSSVHSVINFTDENGEAVKIVEDGQNVAKYVSSRIDDTDHYRTVKFGDYEGIVDFKSGNNNLEGEYTIVFAKDGDKETNLTFSVIIGEVDSYSYNDIKEIAGDEAKMAEVNARLDAFAEEYVSQIVFNAA